MGFEFCEGLFDWIEVWRIGRQQPQHCTGRFDGLADASDLVGGQIIHRDDLPGRECRHQALFEIAEEDFAVHRGVDNKRSGDAVVTQAGDERGHLPVAVRNLCDEPLAARAASARPGHIGRSAGLVDEDELLRIKLLLLLFPVGASCADVVAVLLGGVQAFF